MKKRINLILILMSACVTGITGLQLYWNYQNYKSTVKTFSHDINEALNTAVDKEIAQRDQKIITRFKGWLADTAFETITCNIANRDSSTVFTLKDTHPYPGNAHGISFGITDFKEKLRSITPKAKQVFIDHFGDTTLRRDLKNGIVYFYTPRLGDSLTQAVNTSRYNHAALTALYKAELLAKDIDAAFSLNPKKASNSKPFLTRTINTGLQRPHQKEFVFAGFESPDIYFLRQMKWLIVTSFLLIGITIFCFVYTVKTLLSQQKLSELKNDFVNNMTHELKTPVATIGIAAEAMQDFNLSKTSADEYLGIIRYQAGNLSGLIDQILKSVVLEQENINLNLAVTNAGDMVQKLAAQYKPHADKVNATITYQPADEDLRLMTDEPLLKNAIANLLDNAIKYGGHNAKITIECYKGKDQMTIKITDNGPGIPVGYQDKVFERFFRVPSGDIHNVKGYGLGLSYAKGIAERHGGTLSLISKEGQGTTFIISIPINYHETGQVAIA